MPDRGPTQGRGPTGIRHLAHSISDPRAEISGILVMVRRSSATSRGVLLTGFNSLHFPVSPVVMIGGRPVTFAHGKSAVGNRSFSDFECGALL